MCSKLRHNTFQKAKKKSIDQTVGMHSLIWAKVVHMQQSQNFKKEGLIKPEISHTHACTVKPVKNSHSQKDQKLVFKTNYRLMQVKSIAECSNGSILQYFLPPLSHHLPLRLCFVYLLSHHLTQVLLYT